MKLLGSINSKINKDENGENVPYLEITEGCNVNNSYLQNSRVLYIFMSKNCLYFCINLSVNYQIFHQKKKLFFKTFDSEFSYDDVWFTDQNSSSLEIQGAINITLVIN